LRGPTLLAVTCLACTDVQVTGIRFRNDIGEQCDIDTTRSGRMNAYRVEMYASNEDDQGAPCLNCAAGIPDCQLVGEAFACSTGSPSATIDELGRALQGVTIEDIPGDRLLCIRVLAYELADCDESGASFPENNAIDYDVGRICAFSRLGVLLEGTSINIFDWACSGSPNSYERCITGMSSQQP
jgi:hypothetical protein